MGEAVAGTAVGADVGVAEATATVGEGSVVGEGSGVRVGSAGIATVVGEGEAGSI
jgi:hypothetical protein